MSPAYRSLVVMIAIAATAGACVVEHTPSDVPSDRLAAHDPLTKPGPAATTSTLPPALEARRLAAVELMRRDDPAGGLAALDALMRDAGPSYAIANDRSVALGLLGQWRSALTAADAALAIHDGPEAAANKVQALLGLGDRSAAIDVANAAVGRYPRSVAAQYALGAAHLSVSNYDDARLAFENALDQDPDDLASGLGVLACAAADPTAPELHELGERLLAKSPEDPEVLYLMAAGEEHRLVNDAAKKLYRRAIAAADARGRPHPWAHWNLAQLLEETIDLAAARPHYRAFLDTAPMTAVNERDEAQKKLGQKP